MQCLNRNETTFMHVISTWAYFFIHLLLTTAWGAAGEMHGSTLFETLGTCDVTTVTIMGACGGRRGGHHFTSRPDVGLGMNIMVDEFGGVPRYDVDCFVDSLEATRGARAAELSTGGDGQDSGCDADQWADTLVMNDADDATTWVRRGCTNSRKAFVDSARGDALDRGLPPHAAVTHLTSSCRLVRRCSGSMRTRARLPHRRRHHTSHRAAPCNHELCKGRGEFRGRGTRASLPSGRSRIDVGLKLCGNVHTEAKQVRSGGSRWRCGTRRGGKLCIGVHGFETDFAGQRQGGWRGGRCLSRFCDGAYLVNSCEANAARARWLS